MIGGTSECGLCPWSSIGKIGAYGNICHSIFSMHVFNNALCMLMLTICDCNIMLRMSAYRLFFITILYCLPVGRTEDDTPI